MSVQVPDRLSAVAARIEDDPVSAGIDALGDSDLMGRRDELVEQPVARARQRRYVREVIPRDNQDMRRGLGADVTEGDDPLPVPHDRGRDLSSRDPAEQAVWHSTIIVGLQWRTVPDIASAALPAADARRPFSESGIRRGSARYSSEGSVTHQ
jgi:hypothetical protein